MAKQSKAGPSRREIKKTVNENLNRIVYDWFLDARARNLPVSDALEKLCLFEEYAERTGCEKVMEHIIELRTIFEKQTVSKTVQMTQKTLFLICGKNNDIDENLCIFPTLDKPETYLSRKNASV